MSRRITIQQFSKIVGKTPAAMRGAMVRGLHKAAARMEVAVVEEIGSTSPYPPVDTGSMKQSTSMTRDADGADVFMTAPHAIFMEEGTRPHRPPLLPLLEWAMRKGFDDPIAVARAVVRRIEIEGIAPRFYFKRAYQKTLPYVQRAIDRELRILKLEKP